MKLEVKMIGLFLRFCEWLEDSGNMNCDEYYELMELRKELNNRLLELGYKLF
jgi:hypothetical protein